MRKEQSAAAVKKIISVILSLVFVFSVFPVSVFAEETEKSVPFSYTVYPEKLSYEKGEDIKIKVAIQNTSLDEITDMRIWINYPLTDYYLTPGVTEHFVTSCTESCEETFRVCEDAGVLQFASNFNKIDCINSFLLKLAHAYKDLTRIFTTIKYDIQNCVFTDGYKRLELGKVKVLYDNTEIEFTVKCRYLLNKSKVNEPEKLSDEQGKAEAEIKAVKNSYTGLIFAVEDENNFGLFAINPTLGKAFLYRVEDEKYYLSGTKTVDISENEYYKMQVVFSDNRVLCYIFDNPENTEPYPVFDLYYYSDFAGCGVFTKNDEYNNFGVSEYTAETYYKTYTNPVYANSADPFILKDGKTYYLYATTNPDDGYSVSSSTDLVNWSSLGYCAKKGDIYGESYFWAPEVYKYKGRYYMLYSTDEHLALAVANSPTGPFKKTKDGYLLEDNCIDGHIFFDDDGSIYLYMAYWAETGEEIWGCKMNSDLSVINGTLTQLTTCKDDEGGVNEGPAMLKFDGRYYLTYSVNGYTDKNYSVRLAVSDSPLGTYTAKGNILEKSGPLVGTGHHCFTTSPDGTELIIAYHCHYSTTQIHSRKLCIDRCKFVETADGYTLSVYGPTSTPQSYPSDK